MSITPLICQNAVMGLLPIGCKVTAFCVASQ